ncbi:hypothetical protein [Luteimonas sp. 8-5]|uniref:hypothetical protein n=1 Tax=Luteimonas sp. 8-5 TaxID=3039387 RepID=UPI0024365FCF|nr:hypothetical protein [Luteimonas sp. 8-5]
MYDDDGNYTIRTGAIYRVDDLRIRELAEIGYARRDLEKAHQLIEACAQDDLDAVHPLLEESLCTAAVIMYAKPFGRNNARTIFKPDQLLKKLLKDEVLDVHEYVKRCRDWMIAHDDGLGETKSIGIYLPPSPPRSTLDMGLHFAGRRVVALGQDVARRLDPHFAQVRDLVRAHEDSRRQEIAAELLRSRFASMQVQGLATEERLEVDIETVIALRAAPSRLKRPE